MSKIIIFDAPDRTGKDTQIFLLKKYLIDLPTIIISYSNIKGMPLNTVKEYSKKLYIDGVELIKSSIGKRNVIFNRFLYGEYIYAPLYRNYDGSYIFEIEKLLIETNFLDSIYFISFFDTKENLIKREDGKSHSNTLKLKEQELQLFKEVFEKSKIKNKLLINISDKTIEEIHNLIVSFIF